MVSGGLPYADIARELNEALSGGAEPLDERSAGGHDRNVHARVDVAGALEGVIAVRVRHDRAVAVDTPAKEVSEPFIGDVKRAKPEAFRWHESNAGQPSVKESVRPLQSVAWPGVGRERNSGGRAETSSCCLQQIRILGRDRKMPAVLRQTAVRRNQTDGIRKVSSPFKSSFE
jgi:hypothetical protein